MKKSKRKHPQKKRKIKRTKKQVKPILNKSQTNGKRLFLLFLKIILSIASLTGFIALYFLFQPQITISYSDPIAPSNIFTSRFKIENNGNCNVYDVKLKYRLDKIRASSSTIKNLVIDNFNLSYETPIFKKIRKNRKQSIKLDFSNPVLYFPPDMKTFNAELNIYLEYKYWIYFTKIDSFHFETSKMINNKIIWMDKQ